MASEKPTLKPIAPSLKPAAVAAASAASGLFSSIWGALRSSAPSPAPTPVALPATPVVEVKKVNPWERVRREAELLVFGAELSTSVGNALGKELERSTKKKAPGRVVYELIFVSLSFLVMRRQGS
jgi:hypothetical protein